MAILDIWKACRHQRWLDKVCTSDTVRLLDAVSSMCSLPVLLCCGNESYNTNSCESVDHHLRMCACAAYYPRLLFECDAYFAQSFRLCGYYSRVAYTERSVLFSVGGCQIYSAKGGVISEELSLVGEVMIQTLEARFLPSHLIRPLPSLLRGNPLLLHRQVQ